MLTTEQQDLLELLAPGNYAFSNLTPEQQALLSVTLRPVGTFTEKQRTLLAGWYLLATPEQVTAANVTLAPLNRGISSILTTDDRTVINADLLTDCMRPGDTYHAISPLLATQKLIRLGADAFPLADETLT